MGVQLAGLPTIFENVLQPTIGDAHRPIGAGGIRRANEMMYAEEVYGPASGAGDRGDACQLAGHGGWRRISG